MARFSKRHYQVIAGAFSQSLGIPNAGILTAAHILADALRKDNPKFNKDHFLAVVRGEKSVTSRPSQGQALKKELTAFDSGVRKGLKAAREEAGSRTPSEQVSITVGDTSYDETSL